MDKIEVIFYDDDEKTVLDRQLVDSGSKVVYNGPEPFKAPENQLEYKFVGWIGEEQLDNVTDNLVLVARYETQTPVSSYENALIKASLENARNANLSATIEAGQKVIDQQKALEKDSRTSTEIVADILKNGKTEIGIEQDLER